MKPAPYERPTLTYLGNIDDLRRRSPLTTLGRGLLVVLFAAAIVVVAYLVDHSPPL